MIAESLSLSNQGKNLDLVEALKTRYKSLVFLDVSSNNLNDFNLKFNFANLQSLILDNNKISTIANFPTMKNLETLSIYDNKFNSAMEFAMYSVEKFPIIKVINTLRNTMNPGIDNHDDYIKYRLIFKKIKTLRLLDGLDINDDKSLESYKNKRNVNNNTVTFNNNAGVKKNLFDFGDGSLEDNFSNTNNNSNMGSYNKNSIDNSFKNENSNYNVGLHSNHDENSYYNHESDVINIIKSKKRQSTITFSQRMLKKADNLTKFNRKNHSEGNKHITNNDL